MKVVKLSKTAKTLTEVLSLYYHRTESFLHDKALTGPSLDYLGQNISTLLHFNLQYISMSSAKSRTLVLIYGNMILYALCFQMQRPLEPFLVDQIQKSAGEHDAKTASESYTQLQSFFGIVQMFGSFVSGPLLDKFGAKGGLLVNFACSAMSYYLLSLSTTMDVLYYSKIPTVFQAGYLCGQLAISKITREGTERTSALGLLTTSYLVGNMIGPALGGVLGASGDYFYGAKLATAGSLLSCVLIVFLPLDEAIAETALVLNETDNANGNGNGNGNGDEKTAFLNDKSASSGASTSRGNAASNGLQAVFAAVWLFLSTKLCSGLANALQGAVMPLILKNNFGLKEAQMGYSMSFMPMFNAGVGAVLGSIVKAGGGGMRVISLCLASSTAINIVQSVLMFPAVGIMFPLLAAGSKWLIMAYMTTQVLLSIPQFVLAATITSESTSRVSPGEQGTLLGLEHGLFAAVRIATPTWGQSILNYGGVTAVSTTCAGIYFIVAAVWTSQRHKFARESKDAGKEDKTEQYKRK